MHCHPRSICGKIFRSLGPSEVVQFYVGRFEKILDKQTNNAQRKRVNKNVVKKLIFLLFLNLKSLKNYKRVWCVIFSSFYHVFINSLSLGIVQDFFKSTNVNLNHFWWSQRSENFTTDRSWMTMHCIKISDRSNVPLLNY